MTNRYSRIHEIVSAIQYTGRNKSEIFDLVGSKVKTSSDQESIMVQTPHGNIYVLVHNWIVKKPDGAFHIMRNDEFHEMYETGNHNNAVIEISEDEAKRMLKDIRDIQEELKLTLVHLIEYEKVVMFILADV